MGRRPAFRPPPPIRRPPPPPPIRRPPPPAPIRRIASNIKKTASKIFKKSGLSRVVSNIAKKTGISNAINLKATQDKLTKCSTDFRSLTTTFNNLTTNYNNINNRLNNLNLQFFELTRKYDSKVSELNNKNTQYDKLLNDYRKEIKDKQGAIDYLTINEHFTNVEGLTSQESTAVVNITTNLDYNFYDAVVNQNKKLDSEIQNYKNIYSSDEQKVNYQTQQVNYLNVWNNYLFIVYYTLLLILFYFLYYSNSLLIYMKVCIVVLSVLYPYIIMPVETNLFNLFSYLFSIITGNVYIKNTKNY